MDIFTEREKTVKRFTVKDAINNAKMRLELAGKSGMCMDAIKYIGEDKMITLVELNDISDSIVYDTFSY